MQEDFPKYPKLKLELGTFLDYANKWDVVVIYLNNHLYNEIPVRIPTYEEYVLEKGADPNLFSEVPKEGLEEMERLVKEYNDNSDRLVAEQNWEELKRIAVEAHRVAQKYTQLADQ